MPPPSADYFNSTVNATVSGINIFSIMVSTNLTVQQILVDSILDCLKLQQLSPSPQVLKSLLNASSDINSIAIPVHKVNEGMEDITPLNLTECVCSGPQGQLLCDTDTSSYGHSSLSSGASNQSPPSNDSASNSLSKMRWLLFLIVGYAIAVIVAIVVLRRRRRRRLEQELLLANAMEQRKWDQSDSMSANPLLFSQTEFNVDDGRGFGNGGGLMADNRRGSVHNPLFNNNPNDMEHDDVSLDASENTVDDEFDLDGGYSNFEQVNDYIIDSEPERSVEEIKCMLEIDPSESVLITDSDMQEYQRILNQLNILENDQKFKDIGFASMSAVDIVTLTGNIAMSIEAFKVRNFSGGTSVTQSRLEAAQIALQRMQEMALRNIVDFSALLASQRQGLKKVMRFRSESMQRRMQNPNLRKVVSKEKETASDSNLFLSNAVLKLRKVRRGSLIGAAGNKQTTIASMRARNRWAKIRGAVSMIRTMHLQAEKATLPTV